MGASAEFRCTVTSNGMTIGLQHITWYKDGRQLPSSSRSGDTLLISDVGREDKGMYQCVVRRQDGDSFQASAELQLGGKFNLLCDVRETFSYSGCTIEPNKIEIIYHLMMWILCSVGSIFA